MAKRPDASNPEFIVGESLADIFAEAGIRFTKGKQPAPGSNAKTVCPKCQGGRAKEATLSVKVDADAAGATWKCHRAGCVGWTGSGKIEGMAGEDRIPARRERPPAVKPVLHTEREKLDPNAGLYALMEKRGISRETTDEFGIYAVGRRWPETDAAGKVVIDEERGEPRWVEKATIVFPYRWRGEVVNRKFRSKDKQFAQDRDSMRTLFNADAITSPDVVVLVEGEFDVLACWEAGLRQVVSLPDGAPGKLKDEDDPTREGDLRFEPLENCGAILEGVEKVVIATDADVPGGYLAEEFARRLGRHRCWRVTWPEGCKDANDVLLKHGRDVLVRCVEQAEPWPLAGLWSPAAGSLMAFLRDDKLPRGLDSGIAALDKVARLPAGPGWLTVVTGMPNHGTSTFLRCWLTYHAAKHDMGIVWCSPEDNAPETLALDVAAVLKGQPVRDHGTTMSDADLADAEDWIRRRITFIVSNDPDTDPTLEWILARAEEAKRRQPRHLLVIDPWDDHDFQFGRNETETQYVARWLRKMKAWGRAEGMSVLIRAHPTKLNRDPKTKEFPVADGNDISGGARWHNKADLGLTVYRDRKNEGFMQIHNWKPRFRAFGEKWKHATLKLDYRTGRLSTPAAGEANRDDDDQGDEA
jgi:twinkle protein